MQTGELLKESDPETGHQKVITSMSKSADGSHFITGSHDKTAKLWDIRTLKVLKTYTTERPVNAAAISPLLDHVCPNYSLIINLILLFWSRAFNYFFFLEWIGGYVEQSWWLAKNVSMKSQSDSFVAFYRSSLVVVKRLLKWQWQARELESSRPSFSTRSVFSLGLRQCRTSCTFK